MSDGRASREVRAMLSHPASSRAVCDLKFYGVINEVQLLDITDPQTARARLGMFMDYLFHRKRLRTESLPEATRRCRIPDKVNALKNGMIACK